MKANKSKRGFYGEILTSTLKRSIIKQSNTLVKLASKANKVDEHGNWDFGIDFDSKGRGYALNWDLYAYGKDFYSKKMLIVIQIRQYEKVNKNYYPRIRKNYYLIGRNEDNTVFAHPIQSRVIHSAIKKNEDIILAVQNWIFQSNYKKLIRQGDIALIPVKKPNGDLQSFDKITLQDSHIIKADAITLNGTYYVKNPIVTHIPNTHPEVSGNGWFKIVIGNRATFWRFAAPTID